MRLCSRRSTSGVWVPGNLLCQCYTSRCGLLCLCLVGDCPFPLQFIAGVFLVLAGLQTDEQEGRSLGDALSAVLEQPFFGNFLLGVVAVGLVASGLLMVAVARYRHIA